MTLLHATSPTESGRQMGILGGASVTYDWDIKGLLTDLWVAASAIIAVAFITESVIRRREGRNP